MRRRIIYSKSTPDRTIEAGGTGIPEDAPPSDRIVAALAEELDVDATGLEPLYDAIDPDAIDALFGAHPGSPTRSPRLTVVVQGCRVVVDGEHVAADRLDETTETSR